LEANIYVMAFNYRKSAWLYAKYKEQNVIKYLIIKTVVYISVLY